MAERVSPNWGFVVPPFLVYLLASDGGPGNVVVLEVHIYKAESSLIGLTSVSEMKGRKSCPWLFGGFISREHFLVGSWGGPGVFGE